MPKIAGAIFCQKSMTEIANSLDLKNEHTARTRKYRCQQQLKKLLESDKRYQELQLNYKN